MRDQLSNYEGGVAEIKQERDVLRKNVERLATEGETKNAKIAALEENLKSASENSKHWYDEVSARNHEISELRTNLASLTTLSADQGQTVRDIATTARVLSETVKELTS